MDNQATTDIGVLDQFQNEFIVFWRRLPNKGFFFALLACWLAIFHFLGNASFGYIDTSSLFRWMLTVYLSHNLDGSLSDDSTGLWVIGLFFVLAWWKHKELIELPLVLWWPGLLLLGAGMLLHIVGFSVQVPHISILGLLVGIYGLMSLSWGWKWTQRIFFPFFLLIFMVPLSRSLEPLTTRLQLLSSSIVENICHTVLMIDVVRDGTILKDPTNKYHYEVAAACSGIRSLVSIGLMAVAGAFVFFRQWWRRAVFLALVIPLTVAGNVLRLLTIILVADNWGQSAGNAVHENAIISLVPYVPAIFGLLYVAQRLEEPRKAS